MTTAESQTNLSHLQSSFNKREGEIYAPRARLQDPAKCITFCRWTDSERRKNLPLIGFLPLIEVWLYNRISQSGMFLRAILVLNQTLLLPFQHNFSIPIAMIKRDFALSGTV
jgi:hypothetical protein